MQGLFIGYAPVSYVLVRIYDRLVHAVLQGLQQPRCRFGQSRTGMKPTEIKQTKESTLDENRKRLIDLWVWRLKAVNPWQEGYYQGRFEEYAAQNAISPDDFPTIQDEAKQIAETF